MRVSGFVTVSIVACSLLLGPRSASAGTRPSLAVDQPGQVSATSVTRLTCRASVDAACTGVLTITAVTEDGELTLPVLAEPWPLRAGTNVRDVVLQPLRFAPIGLYEDLTLRAGLSLPDGTRLAAQVDTTLVPAPAVPEAGGWSVTFSSRPALVYTSRDAQLVLTAFSPKPAVKSAVLALKFMDAAQKHKVKPAPVTVLLQPGDNTLTIPVTASTASLAHSKGDVQVKAVLKVGGVVKGSDYAAVDYDLLAAAGAQPTSGPVPLAVTFTGSASGGEPPYAFAWDFGDGGASSEQAPVHTYTSAGDYAPTLTVLDSMGGAVTQSLQVSASDSSLQVTCGASPASGDVPLSVSFTASASGGTAAYSFAWDFGDGASSTEQNPVHVYATAGSYTATVTVTSGAHTASCSRNIVAGLPSFTITASAGAGGTISPGGAVTVAQGADQTFAIAPSSGYGISDVAVDGASVGAVSSYTFHDVQADHTISATFAQQQPTTYTITATSGTGGTITPSGSVVVSAGAGQTFSIAADPGYVIADVTVDGSSVGAVGTYTFTNVQADHTIDATFQAGANHPPVISGLAADPTSVQSATGTSSITFTVTDPDGDNVTWTATLSGTNPSGFYGSLNATTATVPSGTLVTLTYTATKTSSGDAVTVTVNAADNKGGSAAPQSVGLTIF